MVSRRKILNRSRDDLNIDLEEEDIWYQKEKLFKVSVLHHTDWLMTRHKQPKSVYLTKRLLLMTQPHFRSRCLLD